MNFEKGAELPKLMKPAITREQLKAYAGASTDHNPIHLDDEAAGACLSSAVGSKP